MFLSDLTNKSFPNPIEYNTKSHSTSIDFFNMNNRKTLQRPYLLHIPTIPTRDFYTNIKKIKEIILEIT